MLKKLFLMSAATFMLMSCGDSTSQDQAKETNESSSDAKETTNANAGGEGANIKLVITGGDMAGTYTASCKTTCCSHGIAGENVFGTQYSEEGKGPNELSSVQLMIGDVTGDKTTDEFLVTVSFGELFGANTKSYTIQTSNFYSNSFKKQGSGTVDLKYSKPKSTVKLKGKTADNVELDLTIECHTTM